jgi:hypothetical protein
MLTTLGEYRSILPFFAKDYGFLAVRKLIPQYLLFFRRMVRQR